MSRSPFWVGVPLTILCVGMVICIRGYAFGDPQHNSDYEGGQQPSPLVWDEGHAHLYGRVCVHSVTVSVAPLLRGSADLRLKLKTYLR
jgi:hypothetical protein